MHEKLNRDLAISYSWPPPFATGTSSFATAYPRAWANSSAVISVPKQA